MRNTYRTGPVVYNRFCSEEKKGFTVKKRHCLFFSGLHWLVYGLSELRPEQRLLLLLTGESFPFFHDVSEDQCFSNFCSKICCMIRACCRRAPTVFTTASTAQHSSAISPQSICASKQTELARASTCRRAFIPHAEFSKRTKKSKSVRPRRISYCSIFTQRWCDARRICL